MPHRHHRRRHRRSRRQAMGGAEHTERSTWPDQASSSVGPSVCAAWRDGRTGRRRSWPSPRPARRTLPHARRPSGSEAGDDAERGRAVPLVHHGVGLDRHRPVVLGDQLAPSEGVDLGLRRPIGSTCTAAAPSSRCRSVLGDVPAVARCTRPSGAGSLAQHARPSWRSSASRSCSTGRRRSVSPPVTVSGPVERRGPSSAAPICTADGKHE